MSLVDAESLVCSYHCECVSSQYYYSDSSFQLKKSWGRICGSDNQGSSYNINIQWKKL